jgi:p-aminobenzoyl-glutamate transporter AbgT
MEQVLAYISLAFSGIVAFMFVVFIVNFLEYGFGEGEAERRSEAVSRIIWASSMVILVAILWLVIRVFTTMFV